MGWRVPVYAHVPLIHGADGAKLSKRHGALGVDAYRDEMGLLSEAVNNYLKRAGARPTASRSSKISTAIIFAKPRMHGWSRWWRRASRGSSDVR